MNQEWNPEEYNKSVNFVSKLGEPLIQLLSPQRGETVLDLGCGDGSLSKKLLESNINLVAVDSSKDMIKSATAHGLNAKVMDGHNLEFQDKFDAVFSNAALHWMQRPNDVVKGVVRSLKPQGRFVGEFGGHGNVAAIITAIIATRKIWGLDQVKLPWYFPKPEEYKTLLESHGFKVKTISLIPRPTLLDKGMQKWLEIFVNPFIKDINQNDKSLFIKDVVELLEPSLCDSRGIWTADYIRLRFFAELESL